MVGERTVDVAAKYVTLSIALGTSSGVVSTLWDLGERMWESLQIVYAPGHNGLVGVRFTYAGVTILPWNQPTQFVSGSNERVPYEIGLHVSGKVTVQAQNLDAGFAHKVVLTAKLTEILLAAAPPPAPALLDLAAF